MEHCFLHTIANYSLCVSTTKFPNYHVNIIIITEVQRAMFCFKLFIHFPFPQFETGVHRF